MEKLMDFFAMGGFGAFVWPCYGLALAIMLSVTYLSVKALRKAQASLHALQIPPEADEA